MIGGRPGWQELLITLEVALIFFGANQLRELGRGFGDAIRNVRSSADNHEGKPSHGTPIGRR